MRLLIADDHAVLREGLRLLLDGAEGLEVVAEAVDGEDALRKTEELRPDLVLIDLSMPRLSGLEATRLITQRVPGTKVIVLTVHDQEDYVFQALRAGACGYLLKEAGCSEIMAAIKAVAAGGCYLSPRVSRAVVEDYLRQDDKRPRPEGPPLTDREREILSLIAEGVTHREIAARLCLSPKTVENHRSNIMRKLGVHNRVALVRTAHRLGLISLDDQAAPAADSPEA